MEITLIVWQFLYLWGGIYAVFFITKYSLCQSVPTRRQMETKNLLPTNAVDLEPLEEQDHVIRKTNDHHDGWRVKFLRIRFTTRRFNSMFARLARLYPTFWHWWFSLGVVVGGCMMMVDIVVVVGAAFKVLVMLGYLLSTWFSDNNDQQLEQQWVKRNVGYMEQENEQGLLSMIPTIPLTHIGYYISALLICGVIHEAGHAIATFSERVPMQSCGVLFYYIYPGAFVNISDQHLHLLTPFRQLKIICAGTFHNLILYGFTLCMLSGGLKSVLEWTGWQSLEGNGGVSIVHVRSQSPMAHHLPVSSIIYQLDDTELERSRMDWDTFLLDPHGREQPHPGFCAMVNDDSPTTLACCEIDDQYPFGKAVNASISCFRNFDSTLTHEKVPDDLMCLPTIQVLGPRHAGRCETDDECSDQNMKCVTPYTPSKNGQVVRIYARMPDWMNVPEDQDKVFVFEGDLVDIWESVTVGILQPKYWFLPATLPHRSELLLRCISTFSLALAMLNILPAFKWDGDYGSLKFLDIVFQRTMNTSINIAGIHGILVNCVTYMVLFVIVASIVLGIFFVA